jgi:hypothetical protein
MFLAQIKGIGTAAINIKIKCISKKSLELTKIL